MRKQKKHFSIGKGLMLLFFSVISTFLVCSLPTKALAVDLDEHLKDHLNPYMHSAPIILKAFQIAYASGHKLEQYRLISNVNGKAVIIPFQIDETAAYEDFVLAEGPKPNQSLSNGIFDRLDEISFMAQDVGSVEPPMQWGFKKPTFLYRIDAKKSNNTLGSVFVGIYTNKKDRPQKSPKRYVTFNLEKSQVLTSRYKYNFDPDNYLVVKGIDVVKVDKTTMPIVDTSSFFLNLDLKYFLTLNIGHSDIVSKLEAYKSGPIRTIVRVSFAYSFLKLNFEMGMYTEVSFFSNSVILPAIMYNPLNGTKSLNTGSGFYYGFATNFNPANLDITTNMNRYKPKTLFSFLDSKQEVKQTYTLNVSHKDFLMIMNINPSWKMKNTGNQAFLYKEDIHQDLLEKRPWDKPLPLGKAPVNLGVYFDLSNFAEGEHRVGFNLFFENKNNKEILNSYTELDRWYYTSSEVKMK